MDEKKPLTLIGWMSENGIFDVFIFLVICYFLFGFWMIFPIRDALCCFAVGGFPFIFLGYSCAKSEEKRNREQHSDDEK